MIYIELDTGLCSELRELNEQVRGTERIDDIALILHKFIRLYAFRFRDEIVQKNL